MDIRNPAKVFSLPIPPSQFVPYSSSQHKVPYNIPYHPALSFSCAGHCGRNFTVPLPHHHCSPLPNLITKTPSPRPTPRPTSEMPCFRGIELSLVSSNGKLPEYPHPDASSVRLVGLQRRQDITGEQGQPVSVDATSRETISIPKDNPKISVYVPTPIGMWLGL